MDEVILVDDDFEQLQSLQQSTMAGHSYDLGQQYFRPVRKKRAHNGVIIRPTAQREQSTTDLYASQAVIESEIPVSIVNSSNEIVDPAQVESVIVDGQDIFFIQEVEDNDAQLTEAVETPLTMNPPCSQLKPMFDVDSDEEENNTPQQGETFSEQLEMVDYCGVDPIELSDVWNDLITANQEILILLELQDLKQHLEDARHIESQMTDLVCDYCPRILRNMLLWNRHIKKIHYQTELFECDSCDAKFKYYARYKDHQNGHRGSRVYQCDECNQQYAFRTGLIVHKILDHIKINGIYVCPKCDLDCKNLQNYKLHIAKHFDFAPTVSYDTENSPNSAVSTPVLPLESNHHQTEKVSGSTAMPIFTKQSERNKFLNAFKSFSQQRQLTMPDSAVRLKKVKK